MPSVAFSSWIWELVVQGKGSGSDTKVGDLHLQSKFVKSLYLQRMWNLGAGSVYLAHRVAVLRGSNKHIYKTLGIQTALNRELLFLLINLCIGACPWTISSSDRWAHNSQQPHRSRKKQ